MGIKIEDKKYYTPTIEEFHIGFKYEFMNGNLWEESEMTIQDYKCSGADYEIQGSWFEEELLGGIRTVRVKYLDKEDIESLGWKYTPCRCLFEMYQNKEYNLYHYSIASEFNDKSWIEILKDEDYYFSGEIKNKSELKKLMKQLGIYE